MNEEQLIQYLELEKKRKKALEKAEKERAESEAARKEQKKEVWWFVEIIYVTFAIWVFYWGLIDASLPSADRGGWGDKFGGLNALFTGVAFGALVYSLYMQRKDLQSQRKQLKLQLEELELQRKELRLTRKEIKQQSDVMEGQKQQLELQANEMTKQRVHNHFISLLERQNEIRRNLKINHKLLDKKIKEMTPIEYIHSDLQYIYLYLATDKVYYDKLVDDTKGKSDSELKIFYYDNYTEIRKILDIGIYARIRFSDVFLETIHREFDMHYKEYCKHNNNNKEIYLAKFCYSYIFRKHSIVLSHYFRHLYNIIIYVDSESSLDIYSKKKLVNLVQAGMNSDELVLMFYNGLVFPRLKSLITKYNLLENLAVEDLLNVAHRSFYGKCWDLDKVTILDGIIMKERKGLSLIEDKYSVYEDEIETEETSKD